MQLPTLKLTLIRRITELRDESLLQRMWELLMGEQVSEPTPRYDLLVEARQPGPRRHEFAEAKTGTKL